MKSDIQVRAENLAKSFKTVGRKPVVIEFAGIPKAGKTSTLGQLYSFLKRCGFRVEVVVERASMCPIRDKKHTNFNIWTACTTLSQILEKTQTPPRADDPDILILDRGLFDSICWLTMMARLSRLRRDDLKIIENFLRIDDWKKRITVVLLMTASPLDSLERERGYIPVEGTYGSIMNEEVLEQMLMITLDLEKRLKNEFNIHVVNTSLPQFRSNPKQTVEHVVDITLNAIEDQLRDPVYCISRSEISKIFNGKTCLKHPFSVELVKCFKEHGCFLPRTNVEQSDDLVQALPVVVVRNKTGDVLLLRRKEISDDNPLHQKLVIWAGGHVRAEDQINGDAVLRCALRELHEELRISIEPEDLKPMGSIYITSGERTKKHLAIIFEWRASTDDVAIVLSTAEFFERRGTSLSGRFISIDELVQNIVDKKIDEVWSKEIVREFLAPDSVKFHPRLF